MQNNSDSKKPLYRRRRWWLLGVYVFLLVWSGVYRYRQPERPVSPDKKTFLLEEIDGERKLDEKIRVAYKEFPSEIENDRLPVVLIHGSPGDAEVFDGLAPFFRDRRLIAPDLPGFGDSEKDLPDYSVRAHARYVLELMERLKIEKAHLVGFSMGGGVALEMADIAPEKVASISMVSAIGVQEYELMGNYYINHVIHAAQLAFFWCLQELTPNFGVLQGAIPYARNFYDTDQRPLRGILKNVRMPFLIVHGEEDPLVPIEAAREHRRIVPQSEMVPLEDNHFMIFMRPEKLRDPLGDFWNRVENGEAKTRSTAAPDRIEMAARPFEPQIIRARGATAFVYFLLLTAGSFVSEDAVALTAGIWTAQGRFGIIFALVACLFGAFLTNFSIFLFGRLFGRKLLRSGPLKFVIKPEAVERFSLRLEKKRFRTIFLSRFFPGFRLPVYFIAGTLRKDFWKFLFGFLLSAAVRVSALAGLSWLAAQGLIRTSLIARQNNWSLFVPLFGAYFLIEIFLWRNFSSDRD
ncbi:MAG: alpha/beta fold hydrolase [Pyrinomonadaceae bacterium]